MRTLSPLYAFALGAFAALLPGRLAAQVAPPAVTPQQQAPDLKKQREFVQSFKANVSKGCMQAPRKDVRDTRRYCNCLTNIYVNRYTPQQLSVLGGVAAQNKDYPKIMTLMIEPEVTVCVNESR